MDTTHIGVSVKRHLSDVLHSGSMIMAMDHRRVLRVVVGLVSLHSISLGVVNWLFTVNWIKVMRMSMPDVVFWPRQSGAFLISLGLAYGLGAIAPRHLRTSSLVIIFSKSVAVVFLFPEYFFRDAPPAIFFAGLGDLCILITVSALTRWLYRHSASKERD